MHQRTLAARKRVLGEEHLDTLVTMNNLAWLFESQGLNGKAEPLYVETLEKMKRALGAEHRETLNTMNNLARLYRSQQKFEKAEPIQVELLETRRRLLGEEHPVTLLEAIRTANWPIRFYQAGSAAQLPVPCLHASRW